MSSISINPVTERLNKNNHDVWLAIGIMLMLTALFIPLPVILIDLGLAFSIALSILILMVALWIQRPLDFSSFPTILLIATLLRLSLNIATTRVILSDGAKGHDAAGSVIAGFADFVMGGDFVIGAIVFLILITVNFLVITKGATRIAEVGARFTLDAIPGKQMAIDADVSAGVLDEKEAQRRRKELEEESSFFGAMDGASKFVRGDAIAGLIITAINIFGGTLIGMLRHDMSFATAADVFIKLSVGDGLVTQIPALIVSLAAGLLVSKGGTRGSAEKAVFGQLGTYPRALFLSGCVMIMLAIAPGLPFMPFFILATTLIAVSYVIPKRQAEAQAAAAALMALDQQKADEESRQSIKETLRLSEIELCLGKQLSAALAVSRDDLALRVTKLRRKFAKQYGFVVPEIKLTEDLSIAPRAYAIKLHGYTIASFEVQLGDVLVITGEGRVPDIAGDEIVEPAFGMRAFWYPEIFSTTLNKNGYTPVDVISVLLTHLTEILRNNLSQLFSYRDMRALLDRFDADYKRLLDELVPSQLSNSTLHAVLRMLLAERVSVRNLNLILEAVAEAAPHMRRTEQIVDHVRIRLAQQICGDFADNGTLKLLRLGQKWDLAFHHALRKDAKGEMTDFDIEPHLLEQFGEEASVVIRDLINKDHKFVLMVGPEIRAYVRMVIERMFPAIPVLSHLELARGIKIQPLGSISS